MQLQRLLQLAKTKLQASTDTAALDAELLLAHVLNFTRAQLISRAENNIEQLDQDRFWQLLERRLAGEPIAYLLGYREFWSLKLAVSPATLIPRPETELLVELALQKLTPNDSSVRVADLGTGSGAIALALASERPQAHIVATDASPIALELAKNNAVALAISNVEFRLGEWCVPLAAELFTVIVSNPPYLAARDPHLTQGDLRFEPASALVAGNDGLADLKVIIKQAWDHLVTGGWLLVEHGFDQADAVQELFLQAGYANVTSHKDLAGIDRVVVGQKV